MNVPRPTGGESGWSRFRWRSEFYGVGEFLIGLSLLVATLFIWRWLGVGVLDAIIVGIPAMGIVGIMVFIQRSSLPSEHYGEIFRSTLGGAVVAAGFILAVLVIHGTPLVDGLPRLVFMVGIGGLGGIVYGLSRGQAVRAQEQAAHLEHQHERLVFLNALLRHNVLNKIAIIKGHTDVLAEKYDIQDDEHVEIITENSVDVEAVVNNVRVIVQAFTAETSLEARGLLAPIRSEIDAIERTYEDVEVEVDVPDDLSVVAGGLLRYVFQNVLDNAVVHNDSESPQIEVTTERTDDEVRVRIADNGPGIPDRIRSGFSDGDLQANHGVGLYLVDTLMEEYGGSLEFGENTPRGAVVTLTFQVADDETAAV